MALVERYHSQEGKLGDVKDNGDTSPEKAPKYPRKAVSLVQSEERAKRVGILALEVYFPNVYVRIQSLARHTDTQSVAIQL